MTASVLKHDATPKNDQECLNKCNLEENCKFWDFHEGKCRLLLDEGEGPKSGYDGSVSGKKNFKRIKSGPKSNTKNQS